MKEAGLKLSDVDKIGICYDPSLFRHNTLASLRLQFGRDQSVAKAAAISGFEFLRRTVAPVVLGRQRITSILSSRHGGGVPPIEYVPHHLAHAASSYLCSPFANERATVITLDGAGEYESTAIYAGDNGQLTKLKSWTTEDSLGYYYAAITEYLGYYSFNDEYKVMGLAPYGEENQVINDAFEKIIEIDSDTYRMNLKGVPLEAIGQIEKFLGVPRRPKGETNEFAEIYKTIAYHAQKRLQEVGVFLVEQACRMANSPNLCLAGGVALNCKMNKVLLDHPAVEHIFVQPAAGDAGGALGAAAWLSRHSEAGFTWAESDVYAGSEHDDQDILKEVEGTHMPFRQVADPSTVAAHLLSEGRLIGWFQGRTETGPRALGNRSILANPTDIKYRDAVNLGVKHREHWRPFAPSMLFEERHRVLESAVESPFMILTDHVTDEFASRIPAVVHVDGTCRPQTVRKEMNPRYHALISKFNELTGIPVVLNTSFNDNGEPIVNKPSEAIKDFYYMGLDALIIGSVLMWKPHVDLSGIPSEALGE